MDFRHVMLRRVKGQAIAEQLIALLIAGVTVGVIAYFLGRAVTFWGAQRTHNIAEASTTAILQELYRNATSAQAPYLPPYDVGNHSNSDGHEMAFYQMDANHNGYFWSYCYKTSSTTCTSAQPIGTLQRYRYTWSQLPQHGGSGAIMQSGDESTFTAFSAIELTTPADYSSATKNPLAATYFQRHPFTFSSAKTYHWGYPGVTSDTNATYVLTFTLPNGETRPIGINRHHIVFGQEVLYGTATPTPNPMCASSCPNASAALTFQNPIAGSQSATIVESNYGTRSTSPAQVYTLSGCSGTATYSPASPVTPSNNGTGSATLTITPVKQLAPNGLRCTIIATDNASQSIPVSVSIGKTYAPTSSGPGAGLSGQTAVYSVSEGNYFTSPSGGFSAAYSGACNSISRTAASVSGTTETETWSVHFSSTGTCSVTFVDTYGQTTTSATSVACSSYGTPCGLSVSPTSTTICLSGNPCQISQTVSVSESNQYNTFSINDSGCRSGSYATANVASLGSAGGTFTITAATQKTPPNVSCPVVVSDGNGQSASVAVTVDPTPPPPATPTPAPTPSTTACSAANSCYVVLLMGVVCADQYCSSGIVSNGYEGTMMTSSFTQTPNASTAGWSSFNDSGSPANHFAIDTTYCNGGTSCGSAPSQLQTCANNLLNGMVNSNAPNPVETWGFYIYAGHLTNSTTSTAFDYNSSTYNLNNLWSFNGFAGATWYETQC